MVARTLFFAPLLTGLADEIVAGMEAAGVKTFNSLHLRIEKDARDWSMIMGGAGVSMQSQQSLPCKGWASTGLKERSAQSWVCLSTCKEKGSDKGAQQQQLSMLTAEYAMSRCSGRPMEQPCRKQDLMRQRLCMQRLAFSHMALHRVSASMRAFHKPFPVALLSTLPLAA